MTAPDNAATAREFFRLLSEKDVTAWGELWHPDAVITVPYPADGFPTEIRGKDEIVGGFRDLMANFETFQAILTAVYPQPTPTRSASNTPTSRGCATALTTPTTTSPCSASATA